MRLTILGSGTCVPSGRRNSSGYFLEAGEARLRLDAGAGTLHALGRYSLPWEELTHQFISHFHLDHVNELPAFLFTLKYGRSGPRSAPLQLVGPAGLEALLMGMVGVYRQKLLTQEFPLEIRELAPGGELPLPGGGRLLVEKTPHTAESLAVRVEQGGRSLGYTGDTAPSPSLVEFFRGVDLLVCECSFLEDNRKTAHMTADEVADLAEAAGVGHLVATHFYFDPEEARLVERLRARYRGRITLAEDGLGVDV